MYYLLIYLGMMSLLVNEKFFIASIPPFSLSELNTFLNAENCLFISAFRQLHQLDLPLFLLLIDTIMAGGFTITMLSGALDAGLAFMGVLLYLCLGMEHFSLGW